MRHYTEYGLERLEFAKRGYDLALRRILGETYQEELLEVLEKRGLAPDEHLPQLLLPPQRHERSHARYLYDFYKGNDRVLISILGPEKKTSRHYHRKPIVEDYEILRGELYLNGTLIPSCGLIVPSRFVHQAETRDQYALTLIVMKNAKLVRESEQHTRLT